MDSVLHFAAATRHRDACRLLTLNDSKLLSAGVSALSHRKLILARVETLKLLPNQEEALLEWTQGERLSACVGTSLNRH